MPLLNHGRDKVGDFQKRVLIHIPIGLLIGVPLFGIPILVLFVRYEQNEDLHTKDQAWKDYAGAIVGSVITTIGALVWLGLYLLR